MFTEGTYVDASGVLRGADGTETGFAVEDDGRIFSTDGAHDPGGSYLDETGQVFYGDGSPMQGVAVTIAEWPAAIGGQLQAIPLLEEYQGEDEAAARFGETTFRGGLPPDSTQWTTEYDAADTDSVRPRSITGGLLVDETGSPMNGSFGYVLDPSGRLWTFSMEELWIRQGDEWVDLAVLEDHALALAAIKVAVDGGTELKGVHHSTAVAGGPVAGAGTLRVTNGQIVELDDTSGHYKPQAEHLLQTVEWLRQQGMRVDDINLRDIAQQKAAAQILQEWIASHPPVPVGGGTGTTDADDDTDGWNPNIGTTIGDDAGGDTDGRGDIGTTVGQGYAGSDSDS
jgi:hypothetical protein